MIFNKLLWQGNGQAQDSLALVLLSNVLSTSVAACCYVLIYVQLCSAHSPTQHCLGDLSLRKYK